MFCFVFIAKRTLTNLKNNICRILIFYTGFLLCSTYPIAQHRNIPAVTKPLNQLNPTNRTLLIKSNISYLAHTRDSRVWDFVPVKHESRKLGLRLQILTNTEDHILFKMDVGNDSSLCYRFFK